LLWDHPGFADVPDPNAVKRQQLMILGKHSPAMTVYSWQMLRSSWADSLSFMTQVHHAICLHVVIWCSTNVSIGTDDWCAGIELLLIAKY